MTQIRDIKVGRSLRDLASAAGVTVIFFLVVVPMGLVGRFRDPLRLKDSDNDSFWLQRDPPDRTVTDGRKQF